MQFINQYSFLLTAGVAVAALLLVLWRRGLRSGDLVALGALLLGFALAFSLLRPGESTVEEAAAVHSRIGAGSPVLLELQSPY
jgi:hypothetical protein